MPTIHDVAKRAGVAPITVSRVINNSGYFSQETRLSVEAAIAELGYVPNTLARSLRLKRTNTLALIVSDITNPFFTTLARGVEDTASDMGYTVIVCNTDESETEEKKYLQMLLQKQVDGILLVPSHSKPDSIEMIQKHGTPLVVIDRSVPGAMVDVVRGDSEGGAYQLTRLLLSLGHRRIAILSGRKEVSTAVDRVAGYRRAMKEAGFSDDEQYIIYGEYNQASGYDMAKSVMCDPLRPTALIAANNFICLGALKALDDSGLRVPEDISLVAFDDLPPALVTAPFFTVASQPSYEMGRQATNLLVARLSGQPSQRYKEIVLPVEIIVRKSSGPALN
jgi:LacI family transcriptional regulator